MKWWLEMRLNSNILDNRLTTIIILSTNSVFGEAKLLKTRIKLCNIPVNIMGTL